mmetsp:Transcript_21349/g.42835  ORF Transcript_21349/g.42835 Transcript_21349/m.42835 type:complete len:262 (+) Transcript_21349:424-1209(+)
MIVLFFSSSSIATSLEGGEYTYVGVAIGAFEFEACGYGVGISLCCVGSGEGLNVGKLIVCAIVGVDVGGALEATDSNGVVGLAEGFNVCTPVGIDVGGTLFVVSKILDGAAVSTKGVGLAEGFNVRELIASVGVDVVGAYVAALNSARLRSGVAVMFTFDVSGSSIVAFNCGVDDGANDGVIANELVSFVEFDISTSVDVLFGSVHVSSTDRLLFNVTGVIQFVMFPMVAFPSSSLADGGYVGCIEVRPGDGGYVGCDEVG